MSKRGARSAARNLIEFIAFLTYVAAVAAMIVCFWLMIIGLPVVLILWLMGYMS